jgi:hypothetical protein
MVTAHSIGMERNVSDNIGGGVFFPAARWTGFFGT